MGEKTPRTHFRRETNYAEGSQTVKTPGSKKAYHKSTKSWRIPILRIITEENKMTDWTATENM